jgi:hypothetical protein
VAAVSGAETQAVLDELSNEIDRLNKENAALRQRVQLLTHRLFGRRSEKGVPNVNSRSWRQVERYNQQTALNF